MGATSRRLTTQEAADLLGVSRPTVIRWIERGLLTAERVGRRQLLLLGDVLAYRAERRRQQYAAIAATSVEIDDGDLPETIEERLREARRRMAERRRCAARDGRTYARFEL